MDSKNQLANNSFGNYLLQERMGFGGMAEVYKAQKIGLDGFQKPVVIKMMLENLEDDPELVQMFKNEAKIAAMLSHPNIIQTFDFSQFNSRYFITMELIDGFDLKRILKRSEKKKQFFPIELSTFIVGQTLKALDYAHSFSQEGQPLHIIHRDISPHNLLLSKRGEVKIIDFGIAKVLQQVSLTQTGTLKGKTSYMAPEQTFSSKVNHLADIFSTGVILWELLCNQKLFTGINEMEILQKLRHEAIPHPKEFNPQIPDELANVVFRALEREPSQRISSAKEFFLLLQPFMSTELSTEDFLGRFVSQLFSSTLPKQSTQVLKPTQGSSEIDTLPLQHPPKPSWDTKETELSLAPSGSFPESSARMAPVESSDSIPKPTIPSLAFDSTIEWIPPKAVQEATVSIKRESILPVTDEIKPRQYLSQEVLAPENHSSATPQRKNTFQTALFWSIFVMTSSLLLTLWWFFIKNKA